MNLVTNTICNQSFFNSYSNGPRSNIAINLVIDLEIIKVGNFIFCINGLPTVRLDCFIYILFNGDEHALARALQLREIKKIKKFQRWRFVPLV